MRPNRTDRTFKAATCLLLAFGCAYLAPVVADEGEFGIQLGALSTDSTFAGPGRGSETAGLAGLRGGYRFSDHWGWVIDGWFADLESGGQDAPSTSGRTGLERLFGAPDRKSRFFFNLGGGLASYDLEGAPSVDRTFASLGLGQRIEVLQQTYFRWELRGDHTLDDDGFNREDLTTPQLILGMTWGIGGRKDSDRDGIYDQRDECPDTPSGATVDSVGCPFDTDKDGVLDGIDTCPGTPPGWPVDGSGCPLDSDGDGVEDGRDDCKATPRGAVVDERGCPKDTDGDGVADGLDRCPNTPRGARVDAAGCPTDGDGDGVFDGLDKCPDTTAGTKVDSTGCQIIESPPVQIDKPLVLEDVLFAFNSAELSANAKAALDRVAKSLVDWPSIRVEVGGHTDSVGVAVYNQFLSRQRAASVRAYLIQKGVAAGRMTVQGYGATTPRADNATRAGRALNRRVELKKLE